MKQKYCDDVEVTGGRLAASVTRVPCRCDGFHPGVGARDGRSGVGVGHEHVGKDERQVRRDIADRARGPERLAGLPGSPRHHRRTQRHHLQLRNVRR